MTNKILFAIGGGEIGRTKIMPDGSIKQCPVETMHIDNQIIKYSKKKNPKLLVIGTASKDDDGYYNVVNYHYTNRLNCIVNRLDITNNNYTKSEMLGMVNSTDIIYISGGDTRYMLDAWSRCGLDSILIDAYNNGTIMVGCSAGAICWFDSYDNLDYKDEKDFKPSLLKGMGVIPGVMIPHYNSLTEEDKQSILGLYNKDDLYKVKNAEAIKVENGKISFIKNRKSARVIVFSKEDNSYIYLIYRKKGKEKYFVLPGGGLENNESFTDAAKRETLEELGFNLINIKEVDNSSLEDNTIVKIFTSNNYIECNFTGEELKNTDPNNYYEIRKYNIDDISSLNLKPSYYKKLILDTYNKLK
jgi:peptidase E